MAETLILKIRTEALRGNLEKINSLLEEVPDRRTDLNKLLEELNTLGNLLGDARKKVMTARINLELKNSEPETAEILVQAEEQMTGLQKHLHAIGYDIKSMLEKCLRIQETEIGRGVASSLETWTHPVIQTLIDIEPQLQNPNADLQQQWKSFQEGAHIESQRIFTEYIEFLGGLALRDTGFDAGICMVAEELIQKYSTKQKKRGLMLAIPTHQQAVVNTLSGVIPVAFPDWTIWSLPSTAFEFWHVVAQKDLEGSLRAALRALTNPNETVEPRFNNCLADAFATYTMGPAYAFFAILLLLNPASPFIGTRRSPTERRGRAEEYVELDPGAMYPGDEVRAHAIFQMLEHMNSQAPTIAPAYTDVREQLIGEWNNAVAQIGCNPSDKVRMQVDIDKKRATLLVQALWNTLLESISAPFTIHMWDEIKTLVPAILENRVDEISLPVGAELRHVLNAAWLARVDADRDPKWDITRAVDTLAKRIFNKR